MPLDESDFKIASLDPLNNSLEARSIRILDSEIMELERQLDRLKFVRDVLYRHKPIPG